MAEIHVERKRRSPLLPILALLALALLAFLLLRGRDDDEVRETGAVVDTMTATTTTTP